LIYPVPDVQDWNALMKSATDLLVAKGRAAG
jgi:hypothetical protein